MAHRRPAHKDPRRRTPAPAPPPPPARLVDELRADPTLALLPLRAFLGFTFCYAGLQKLANPNFFRSASPISIQAQLKAATHTSPIHGLLSHLLPAAGFVGFVIAVSELAVGLGVLAGVLTRVAAVGGMLLSFGLFLSVSFHSRPWYTGADIGYVFAFTPLLIAGAGERLTLPALVDHLTGLSTLRGRRRVVDEQRRRLLITGGLGLAGVAAGGLAAIMGRAIGGTKPPKPANSLSTGTTSPSTATVGTAAPTTAPAASPSGTAIGPASGVPVGGAAQFQDPASGDPGIVIQPKAGQFVAFDAICPHAGCTVEFAQAQNILVCPCHGSLFNAATGAVEQGPAGSGLRTITVSEGPGGQLFAS